MIALRRPNLDDLPAYAHALQRGWSPNTTRDVSAEQLAAIAADPAAFLDDLLRQGGPHPLPNGRIVERLPHRPFWIFDAADDFSGVISLRWQHGTDALPDYCSGHVGYAVVPWRRRRGIATEALRRLLPIAREVGLGVIEITADATNTASRRVIEANGGRFVGIEAYSEMPQAAVDKAIYRIELAS